ncbi:MNS1 [Symbiodinium natans]|uniref:Meiosis-specific nuclear structural protein 1 n=1 Tax=Symbiodinium natans TaxID=878477 RepID=A0A812VER7_9DINO|nr:MNS1 [Symbiodinium natans]
MSSTKRFVEQRVVKRREQEAKNLELRRRLMENNIYAGYGKSELNVEKKRRALSEAAERRELFMDYSFVKSEQDKTKRVQIAQFEEQLADELAKRKAEQMRHDMDRRRICDGSEELRALKERLHMAKVNKERAQQLLEIEVRKEKDRITGHLLAEHMENERLEQQELEHKLDIEKKRQRERVKVINQQQIAMKEAQREEALQEYIKERNQVEELVAKIADEDANEARARAEKQMESRIMLQQFMVEQKANQEKLEAEEKAENERIEQFARDKREREERLEQERQEKEKEKLRILNAMLGQMEAKNKEAEELELLRNDLHLEELEAESRRREEMQMRKKLEDKEEMKNAYLVQMRAKEEKMYHAREEEARMREELLKKFAEDDRLEQLNEHKRRMKVEQHKREAERLVELRREMYELARAQEREEQDALRKDEDKRRLIIEDERRRLLREHGQELKKFLPKHTLESMEDYKLLFGEDPSP